VFAGKKSMSGSFRDVNVGSGRSRDVIGDGFLGLGGLGVGDGFAGALDYSLADGDGLVVADQQTGEPVG
jgi:hypothetical protein